MNLSVAIYGCESKNNGNTLSYLKPDKSPSRNFTVNKPDITEDSSLSLAETIFLADSWFHLTIEKAQNAAIFWATDGLSQRTLRSVCQI